MFSVLSIVLPIFALVLAGYVTRRLGLFGPQATRELNRFVVYLALPALIVDIVANAQWTELHQPAFIAVFGSSTLAILFLAIIVARRKGRTLGEAAVEGLGASYSNTAYLGFPFFAAVFGPASRHFPLLATLNTVCVLFAGAVALIEFDAQAKARPLHLLRRVAQALLRNPLVLAPLVGAVILVGGLELPAPVDGFLKMLGSATSPCALVCLGFFLAEPRESDATATRQETRRIVWLVGLKLIAYPALTLALAHWLIPLDTETRDAAVILAAMPTGTGPFMLAEFHRLEGRITARVILISTVLSVFTLPIALILLGRA